MWRGRRADDVVLEECLERLAAGETVAGCLERYPERALELRPALEAARRLMEQQAHLAPDAGFRWRTRQRLLQAFAEQGSRRRRSWRVALTPRLAAIGAAFVVVVALGMGTTYRAAAESVPGEPLYWVKERTEQVRLAFARSEEAQVQLQAVLAEERAKEGRDLLRRGAPHHLPLAEERFRERVQQAIRTVGVYPGEASRLKNLSPSQQQQLRRELSLRLRNQAQRQAAELQFMLQTASPEMRPHLRQLLATLDQEYGQALLILEATSGPSNRR